MRRYKTIKGITLIALVITIIVMLILVGVTLNVVLNGNLIGNASDAKDKQEIERDKELLYVAALGCMENGRVKLDGENGLNNNLPEGFTGTNGKYIKGNNTFYVDENGNVIVGEKGTYINERDITLGEGVTLVPKKDLTGDIEKAVKDGKISAVLKETIDGKEVIAVVPVGFTVSSTDGENTISEGLVVRDNDGNEFVWIPIPDVSKMAVPIQGQEYNYRGVLYNWFGDRTGETEYVGIYFYNEPKKLKSTLTINDEEIVRDSQESFEYYAGVDENYYSDTMYQDDFNEMVENVEKYKGFYIGRYETGGFNTTTVVCKSGEKDNSIRNVNWYKAYKMQKEFARGKEGIGSSMIWSCQWDQVMKFINGKEDGTGKTYDVREKGLARHTRNLAATGNNINDKVQNIFDLEGNIEEWSQAGSSINGRYTRGGNYTDYYASNRNEKFVDVSDISYFRKQNYVIYKIR